MSDGRRERIIEFANQVGDPGDDGLEIACARNWLTSEGEVTDEGARLVEGLDDEREGRTVLRGNY